MRDSRGAELMWGPADAADGGHREGAEPRVSVVRVSSQVRSERRRDLEVMEL